MLLGMGFPKDKVEQGLKVTGNVSVQAAMEWILEHQDDDNAKPGPSKDTTTQGNEAGASEAGPSSATPAPVALSLKCNECGKLFTSELDMQYHAAKSGHVDFAESTEEKKPLTEEERLQQMKLLEEKLKQKREEREENEKKEAQEREKSRVKSGKELTDIKRKMEEEEMKKILEERRRDKEEEKKARMKVKALIEADKLARKKAAGGGEATAEETTPTKVQETQPTSQPAAPAKSYDSTKIQMRLTDGSQLVETFSSNETLAAVRLYVEMHRTDAPGPFGLMTTFPRKIFAEDDYENSLRNLGLVPSAVVTVTRNC